MLYMSFKRRGYCLNFLGLFIPVDHHLLELSHEQKSPLKHTKEKAIVQKPIFSTGVWWMASSRSNLPALRLRQVHQLNLLRKLVCLFKLVEVDVLFVFIYQDHMRNLLMGHPLRLSISMISISITAYISTIYRTVLNWDQRLIWESSSKCQLSTIRWRVRGIYID